MIRIQKVGFVLLAIVGHVLAMAISSEAAEADHGYSTVTRVQYVLACLASEGETADNLHRCACAIDRIAEKVSADQFVTVETILRMRGVPGENTGVFRDVAWMNQAVEAFESVEISARKVCFGV